MSTPAAPFPHGEPSPPDADPVAIRACLPTQLLGEFDGEWERALDQAKADKNLAGVHKLLHKWRHIAYAEMRDPGSNSRLLAKAEQIIRTGENPTAGSFKDMQALIRERLGRQVYHIVPDDEVFEQVAALPTEALRAYFEVLDVLQLTPWNGEPQNPNNPGGEVRRWHFGPGLAGQVVYLVLEDRQEVHVLMVQWLG